MSSSMGQQHTEDKEASAVVNNRPLLIFIAVILGFAALKAMRSVTMPLAVAVFLVILVLPVLRAFQRYLPRALSLGLAFSVVLAFIGAFLGSLALSASIVATKAPDYVGRIVALWDNALLRIEESNIPIDTSQLGI